MGSVISEKSIREVKNRSIEMFKNIDSKSSTFATFISLGSKSIDFLDKKPPPFYVIVSFLFEEI